MSFFLIVIFQGHVKNIYITMLVFIFQMACLILFVILLSSLNQLLTDYIVNLD